MVLQERCLLLKCLILAPNFCASPNYTHIVDSMQPESLPILPLKSNFSYTLPCTGQSSLFQPDNGNTHRPNPCICQQKAWRSVLLYSPDAALGRAQYVPRTCLRCFVAQTSWRASLDSPMTPCYLVTTSLARKRTHLSGTLQLSRRPFHFHACQLECTAHSGVCWGRLWHPPPLLQHVKRVDSLQRGGGLADLICNCAWDTTARKSQCCRLFRASGKKHDCMPWHVLSSLHQQASISRHNSRLCSRAAESFLKLKSVSAQLKWRRGGPLRILGGAADGDCRGRDRPAAAAHLAADGTPICKPACTPTPGATSTPARSPASRIGSAGACHMQGANKQRASNFLSYLPIPGHGRRQQAGLPQAEVSSGMSRTCCMQGATNIINMGYGSQRCRRLDKNGWETGTAAARTLLSGDGEVEEAAVGGTAAVSCGAAGRGAAGVAGVARAQRPGGVLARVVGARRALRRGTAAVREPQRLHHRHVSHSLRPEMSLRHVLC